MSDHERWRSYTTFKELGGGDVTEEELIPELRRLPLDGVMGVLGRLSLAAVRHDVDFYDPTQQGALLNLAIVDDFPDPPTSRELDVRSWACPTHRWAPRFHLSEEHRLSLWLREAVSYGVTPPCCAASPAPSARHEGAWRSRRCAGTRLHVLPCRRPGRGSGRPR